MVGTNFVTILEVDNVVTIDLGEFNSQCRHMDRYSHWLNYYHREIERCAYIRTEIKEITKATSICIYGDSLVEVIFTDENEAKAFKETFEQQALDIDHYIYGDLYNPTKKSSPKKNKKSRWYR